MIEKMKNIEAFILCNQAKDLEIMLTIINLSIKGELT